ncbi:hypothetical protein BG261_08050 [Floricoccus tropicus]|uniref:Uncharacterized protein n=1 Tax=Floricoccus tropicus TaxID=1859473 RepID=A0A1E8GJT7_9LACT|nr:hypothetical protein [Floricoccus tropicus]OFI48226.1 hypothetical protein BG261_08050 [Floricoccus tropicus]
MNRRIYNKKTRDFKRRWNSAFENLELMKNDYLVDEVFVAEVLDDTYKRRKHRSYVLKLASEFIKILEDRLEYFKDSDKKVIGWINISRLSESSIFIFENQSELDYFFQIKIEDYSEDLYKKEIEMLKAKETYDSWLFYLKEISLNQVEEKNNYILDYFIDHYEGDYLFCQGYYLDDFESFVFEKDEQYLLIGDIENAKNLYN